MWGSLENYKLKGTEKLEEDYVIQVPIIHKNQEYMPTSVSCGNQYTLVVCSSKKNNLRNEGKNNQLNRNEGEGVGSGGIQLPSSAYKPSMDSRSEDFEILYQYFRAILDLENKFKSKDKLFVNLSEIFYETDQKPYEGYMIDDNNTDEFVMPIYYENFSISTSSFIDRMQSLLESEDGNFLYVKLNLPKIKFK